VPRDTHVVPQRNRLQRRLFRAEGDGLPSARPRTTLSTALAVANQSPWWGRHPDGPSRRTKGPKAGDVSQPSPSSAPGGPCPRAPGRSPCLVSERSVGHKKTLKHTRTSDRPEAAVGGATTRFAGHAPLAIGWRQAPSGGIAVARAASALPVLLRNLPRRRGGQADFERGDVGSSVATEGSPLGRERLSARPAKQTPAPPFRGSRRRPRPPWAGLHPDERGTLPFRQEATSRRSSHRHRVRRTARS
jgi:hypothetical protein